MRVSSHGNAKHGITATGVKRAWLLLSYALRRQDIYIDTIVSTRRQRDRLLT
jgi:hypothetical protein